MQGRRIQAKSSTTEMYATIDQLVNRLAVQIRKYKERQADHKEPAKKSVRKALRPVLLKEEEELEVIRPARAVLSLEDAKRRLAALPGSLVVFTSLSSGKVQILQRVDRTRVVLIDP